MIHQSINAKKGGHPQGRLSTRSLNQQAIFETYSVAKYHDEDLVWKWKETTPVSPFQVPHVHAHHMSDSLSARRSAPGHITLDPLMV